MTIKVAELFAGVGGFRLGLDRAGGFETVWANQWEPPGTEGKQFAWRCYESHFGEGSCVNEDIAVVLDQVEAGAREIPDFDMLVGGFPCQDYSVAKPAPKAKGIEGGKGVLWWQIYRLLEMRRPTHVLLENVDRLLKSPTAQRGRDFAIILSCLHKLGYVAEWRVINAADYGMPQRRRRVYIYATLGGRRLLGSLDWAFPCLTVEGEEVHEHDVSGEPWEISKSWPALKVSPWQNGGLMDEEGRVFTSKVEAVYDGPRTALADIRVPDSEVPDSFFIDRDDIPKWEAQRASKKIERTTRDGFTYTYSEGAMAWPDPLDKPARTILTGEGGKGASRMKHAICAEDGRIRRLVPDELDMIQMFPKGWTRGMSDNQRAFCMGNALVVGVVERIGKAIIKDR